MTVMVQIAQASVRPQDYGVSFSKADSAAAAHAGLMRADSLLKAGPLRAKTAAYSVQQLRAAPNRTPDFYLLTMLAILLGGIRYADPRYFALLLGAYRNPGTGRQWRDMLQAATLPTAAMNVFFAAVAGAYIYYLSVGATTRALGYKAPLVLLLLIAGMLAMYGVKYGVLRATGRAFRAEELAEQYIFNVFLINKIIGVVLLPFVVIIAFAGHAWVRPIGILSGGLVIALLVTRYLRSWPALYMFFKGSRFHFFIYLCASEILPMAVLVKWLLHLLR